MSETPAYPLRWPTGYPRTPAPNRKRGRFTRKEHIHNSYGGYDALKNMTVAESLSRLQGELDKLGARYTVVSSNIELRLDGRPRSGEREPADPGVAVYFQLKGRPIVMPCDRYTKAADNIAAVAAHIAAVRAIERHGVGTVEQMFTGFQAIRGPGPKPWREVLGIKPGVPVTRADIEARRRELARQHHPDNGGNGTAMAEINAAADAAMEEI